MNIKGVMNIKGIYEYKTIYISGFSYNEITVDYMQSRSLVFITFYLDEYRDINKPICFQASLVGKENSN